MCPTSRCNTAKEQCQICYTPDVSVLIETLAFLWIKHCFLVFFFCGFIPLKGLRIERYMRGSVLVQDIITNRFFPFIPEISVGKITDTLRPKGAQRCLLALWQKWHCRQTLNSLTNQQVQLLVSSFCLSFASAFSFGENRLKVLQTQLQVC